eukprot:gene8015-1693_t
MSLPSFNSRRSAVYSTHGVAASSQPLATEIGLSILKAGGNAADAAVAMAAALNVTEPCSTGIGGDCFCMFFDAATGKVSGVNGSGRTPKSLNLDQVRADGITGVDLPLTHPHTVTVPGAAAGWCDTLDKFGTMTIDTVLAPAIKMAEEGFPVHPMAAHGWESGSYLLKEPTNKYGGAMLKPDGQAPKAGDIMRMPELAATFREVAAKGKDGFYKGRIAEAIATVLKEMGGVMTVEDIEAHTTTFEDPIMVDYKGHQIYEIAPNGQGLTALMALNILEEFDLKEMGHNSTAMRLSFADTRWYVTDPEHSDIPLGGMLSKSYAKARRDLMSPDAAVVDPVKGAPADYSDTVYFSVVDGDGNACSFINSNYMGFGSGIVPEGCGFTLQNRASKMPLDPEHPNGHVQVLCNMIEFGMDPQEALDAARFCVGPG